MAKDPGAGLRNLQHGAYSKNLAISGEKLETRPEVVEAIRERALRACKAADVIQSYIARRVNEGADLDSIRVVTALPAFQNSAARLLQQLYAVLPDDKNILDIGETIAKAVKEHEERSS